MEPRTPRRFVGAVSIGPLVPFEALLRKALTDVGYAPYTVDQAVRTMARLSLWMLRNDVALGRLTDQQVEWFLAAQRHKLVRCRGIGPVLRTLRDVDAVPQGAVDASAVDSLLRDFRDYLVVERGLSAASVRGYVQQARKFLVRLPEPLGATLGRLDSATVLQLVVQQSATASSVESTWAFVTAVRSLLRYLHVAGTVPVPLARAVPRRAGWRLSRLPRGIPPQQVEALLSAIADSDTSARLRDHALLTLLARLGLRAAEAAALSLSDIDWRRGQILVRGKGSSEDWLPIPMEVGQSLTAYLTQGRPNCSSRALFVTANAPYQAMSSDCVRAVMARACARAGLPRIGAHRLRHSLATNLLRSGAGLAEIGQLLRHRRVASTAVYAKVDDAALRTLAKPWPAGAR